MTRIARACLAGLRRQADASPDREICGLLFGSDECIESAAAAQNVAAMPEDAFEIDPTTLIAALKAERAGGARLIGCYHSHPSGSAEPSLRDRTAAERGRLWLIFGRGEARLWRAGPQGFAEEPLQIE